MPPRTKDIINFQEHVEVFMETKWEVDDASGGGHTVGLPRIVFGSVLSEAC